MLERLPTRVSCAIFPADCLFFGRRQAKSEFFLRGLNRSFAFIRRVVFIYPPEWTQRREEHTISEIYSFTLCDSFCQAADKESIDWW
jgi:hypothetical protein